MDKYTVGMLLMGLGVVSVGLFLIWLSRRSEPKKGTTS